MRPGGILGEGSFGRVFLVELENGPKYNCSTIVVCKKVTGSFLDTKDERDKYKQNELAICSNLVGKSIPHVVKILKVVDTRVVMEFGGFPLDEMLECLVLSRSLVMLLLGSLTIAVKGLLRMSLIHRDIATSLC